MRWTFIEAELLASWTKVSGLALAVAGGSLTVLVIWLLMSWRKSLVVATLRKKLGAAENEVSRYRKGLGGLAPEAAAVRLRRAEHFLASLPARRLTDQQKQAIVAADCPPLAAPRLTVLYDPASREIDRYAHDFVDAFAAAPGWNVVDERFPKLPYALFPEVGVGVGDPSYPNPTEQLVIAALSDAGVAYEVMPRCAHGSDAELIVSGWVGELPVPSQRAA